MRISDWSSDVCSSDLKDCPVGRPAYGRFAGLHHFHRGKRRHRLRISGAATAGLAIGTGRYPANPGAPGADRWISAAGQASPPVRSEEHTSELQSLMRISYAVFCLKKKTTKQIK